VARRVFIAAIILAILLHIFVLLIHFAMPAPSEQSTKEIAISIHPTEDVIKHADFLAQADQQGSGLFGKLIGCRVTLQRLCQVMLQQEKLS
jgi:protein TonB